MQMESRQKFAHNFSGAESLSRRHTDNADGETRRIIPALGDDFSDLGVLGGEQRGAKSLGCAFVYVLSRSSTLSTQW